MFGWLQAASDKYCALGAEAGPLIFDALSTGGDSAKTAIAALWFGRCSNPDAFGDAYKAFLNSTDLRDTTNLVP